MHRKIKLLQFLLFLCLFCFPFGGKATHIVGGEIYYDYLGGDSYRIFLKLYRDCYSGQAAYDNPAAIGVYNSSGTLITTISMAFPGSNSLPIIITSPCLVPPTNVCVEEAVYAQVVSLPAIPGGYDLMYQRCCRNNSIVNIVNPGGTGSTYMAHIPDPGVVTTNSSPHFNNFPPLYLCTNTPLVFDHSATDPDGDSLVYEFCDPFEGADANAPMPNPPSPPPYANVVFGSGYSASYPIAANPAFTINPVTGLLTGTPNQIGQYVVGVCCSEYRNGVLLSINKRDFQFNVGNCDNAIASIPSQTVFCNGYLVDFINNSSNATNFYWDFGDPNSTTDFSSLQSPSYTYSDSGVYQVTLIAYNNNSNCSDTAYSTFYVYPLLQPDFTPPQIQCFGPPLNFNAGGSYTSDATFSWYFGDATMPTSTLEDPSNIGFPAAGTYNVSFTAEQYGCSETVTKPVTIAPQPIAKIGTQPDECAGKTISFIDSSTFAVNYQWNFGDLTTTNDISSQANPVYTYPDTGYYTITLFVVTGFCTDSTSETYHILPELIPEILTVGPQCLQGNNFSFQAGGIYDSIATFNWNFGTGSNIPSSNIDNPSGIIFTNAGFNLVTLTMSQYGCVKSADFQAQVIAEPVAIIAPQTEFCVGHTVTLHESSQNATGWFWNFGDPSTINDTSSLQTPTYTYADTGSFPLMLIAYNQFCPDTTFGSIKVNELFAPTITVNQRNQCVDEQNFNFAVGGSFTSQAIAKWNFIFGTPDVANGNTVNGVTFPEPGTYDVILNMSEYGCSRTVFDSVLVYPKPFPLFDFKKVEGCPPLVTNFTNKSFSATPATFEWDFGDGTTSTDNDPEHIYTKPGLYDVSLTLKTLTGCVATLTISKDSIAHVFPIPDAGFTLTPEETTIYGPVLFEDYSINNTSCTLYLSNSDSIFNCSMYYAFQDTGFHKVTQWVANEFGCLDSMEKFIYVKPDYAFYVPNAFTPSADGINEIFRAYGFGVKEFDLKIFDRWGRMIFQSTDFESGWDGKINGSLAQQDVYVYHIDITSDLGNYHRYYGTVTLLR